MCRIDCNTSMRYFTTIRYTLFINGIALWTVRRCKRDNHARQTNVQGAGCMTHLEAWPARFSVSAPVIPHNIYRITRQATDILSDRPLTCHVLSPSSILSPCMAHCRPGHRDALSSSQLDMAICHIDQSTVRFRWPREMKCESIGRGRTGYEIMIHTYCLAAG